jgi:hypothetical protein
MCECQYSKIGYGVRDMRQDEWPVVSFQLSFEVFVAFHEMFCFLPSSYTSLDAPHSPYRVCNTLCQSGFHGSLFGTQTSITWAVSRPGLSAPWWTVGRLYV